MDMIRMKFRWLLYDCEGASKRYILDSIERNDNLALITKTANASYRLQDQIEVDIGRSIGCYCLLFSFIKLR